MNDTQQCGVRSSGCASGLQDPTGLGHVPNHIFVETSNKLLIYILIHLNQ